MSNLSSWSESSNSSISPRMSDVRIAVVACVEIAGMDTVDGNSTSSVFFSSSFLGCMVCYCYLLLKAAGMNLYEGFEGAVSTI